MTAISLVENVTSVFLHGRRKRWPRRGHRRRLASRLMRVEPLEDRMLLSIGGLLDQNMALVAGLKADELLVAQATSADPNSAAETQPLRAEEPQFAQGEILIGFEREVPAVYGAKGAAAALEAAGKLVGAHGLHSPEVLLEVPAAANRAAQLATRWQLPAGADVLQMVARLTGRPGIAYAEPNYLVSIDTTPNDAWFSELWGMHNTGQTGGTADADIDALEAWDIATGSLKVVVGVVDTGIDYTHPDLFRNVWINQGEIPSALKSKLKDVDVDGLFTFADLNDDQNESYVSDSNFNGYIDGKDLLSDSRWVDGADNDRSGYKDDLLGWDFYNNDNDPLDDHNHGTHVSGTIGAMANNATGVVGVNWNVEVMGLKFLSSSGSGYIATAAKAIDYATKMRSKGVNIVLTSNSWGASAGSQTLYNAIQKSGTANMLFVASAGNGYTDADVNPSYPAAYDLPNIISVAATDPNDAKADFSNWGVTSVDLGAPGVSVLSTTRDNTYSVYSGTSMAAPHVSGVAALAWSLVPGATYTQIRQAIFDGVDKIPALDASQGSSTPVETGGRLNAVGMLGKLAMVVTGGTPGSGAVYAVPDPAQPPTQFVVHFSYPVASVDAGKLLKVNGTPASSWSISGQDVTYTFGTSPVSAEGDYTMTLPDGAVSSRSPAPLGGSASKAWNASFYYTEMQVVSTIPADGATVPLSMTSLAVTFSEAYEIASADPSDLILSRGQVVGVDTTAANTVVYTLEGIDSEGSLTVEMRAGALTDTVDNPMAAFSASFTQEFTTLPMPAPLKAEAPLGSLVYESSVSGSIDPAGDTDSFTVTVDPSQTITVVVTPGVYMWNGHLYALTSSPLSWAGAEAEAVSRSGHLVAINSQAEQTFLVSTFLSGSSGANTYFIGLTDKDSEGVWQWTTGEPVTYTNWAPGEPNGGVNENYGAINWPLANGYPAALGDWDDVGLNGIGGKPVQGIAEFVADPASLLQPKIELSDASGVIARADAGAAGNDAVIQTIGPTSGGVYTITVAGVGTSTGAYRVQLILNAAAEQESNDTVGTAQNIDVVKDQSGNILSNGSFNTLVGSAQRGAVLGTITGTTDTDVYSFQMSAGQSAMLALTSAAGNLHLELDDGTTWLPANAGKTNVSEWIQDTNDTAAALTRYARVSAAGAAAGDYSLVVTLGADFDLEDNSGPEPWKTTNPDPSQTLQLDAQNSAVLLGHVVRPGESFEEGNLNDFTGPGMSTATVTPPAAHEGAYGLATDGDLTDWIYRDDSGVHVERGDVLSVWVRSSISAWDPSLGKAAGRAYFGFGATASGTLSIVMAPNTSQLLIQRNAGYGFEDIGAVSQSWLADHWYRMEVAWAADGTITGKLYDSDGTTLLNTLTATDTTIRGGGIAFRGFDGSKHFDTVVTPLNSDFYTIHVPADSQQRWLNLSVARPAADSGEFVNLLNPKVRLYDASGTPLGADGDASTPRDAQSSYPIPATAGTYYVEVLASDSLAVAPSRGEYVLDVDLSTTPPEQPRIIVSNTCVTTSEAGGNGQVWVVLATDPGASVTVALSSNDTTEGTVPSAPLTFGTVEHPWNVPQTFTVTGVNDWVDDGDVAYHVTVQASSSTSPAYNGLTVDIAALNLDDDTADIAVNPTSGLVTTEAGQIATFTVQLNSQPAGSVTIEVSSAAPAEGRLWTGTTPPPADKPSTIMLTFTSGNWNIPQTVTVFSNDDMFNDGPAKYVITVKAVGGDPAYATIPPKIVSVLDIDNDAPASSWTVIEGFETTAPGTYLTKYYTEKGTSNSLLSAAAARDGNWGLQDETNSGYLGWRVRTDAQAQVQPGQVFSVYVNSQGLGWTAAYFGFGAGRKGTYAIAMYVNVGVFAVQRVDGYGTYVDLVKVPQVWEADHWYRMEVEWKTTTTGDNIIGRLYDLVFTGQTVTERLLNTVSAKDTTYTSGGIAFRAFGDPVYFDTVLRTPIPQAAASAAKLPSAVAAPRVEEGTSTAALGKDGPSDAALLALAAYVDDVLSQRPVSAPPGRARADYATLDAAAAVCEQTLQAGAVDQFFLELGRTTAKNRSRTQWNSDLMLADLAMQY